MRIMVLRNLGAGLPRYAEGDVVDVTTELASALIQARLAVSVQEPPAVVAADEPAEVPAAEEPTVPRSTRKKKEITDG